MKFAPILMSSIASLAVLASPQAAQAQHAIPITGGSIEVRSLNNAAGTTATFNTPQGTVSSDTASIVSTNGWLNPCCSIVGHISGIGFSPSGSPIAYSNLPFAVETIGGIAYLPISGGARRDIAGGMINGAFVDHSVPRARNMHTPGVSIMHNLRVQSNPDMQPGQFSFEKPVIAPKISPAVIPAPPSPAIIPASPSPTPPSPALPNAPEITASTFRQPDPWTEPGHPANQNPEATVVVQTEASDAEMAQQVQHVFRPNGVHTRIMPVWTPGLYQ
ncbi:MAG: hypothetical protein F6J87_28480 [Spirulina sp. SIO3F2]|nr:hypothetical protein [Spirulina sp. SIO3F2]